MRNLEDEIGKSIEEVLDAETQKNSVKNKDDSQKAEKSRKFNKYNKSKKRFDSRKKKILLISCGILLLIVIAVIMIFLLKDQEKSSIESNLDAPAKQQKVYSPLTGMETTKERAEAPILAAMIENSPEARPQSGLKDAGVIFEAVAEGGVTRFIALYQEAQPSLIGPIRSVRPHYLEWATVFDPAVAHVGGSPAALDMIQSGAFGVDLDQFSNGSSYWRTNDRYAPHNVYTNYEKMSELMSAKNKKNSHFVSWKRQDGKIAADSDLNATSIDLSPSTSQYAVHYNFDKASNTYKRYEAGQIHNDREQGQISPNVVIAIYAEQYSEAEVATMGGQKAYIFQNGKVIQGDWRRNSIADMMHFTDEDGKEIKLNRGQIWITAVGMYRGIKWQ